MSRIKIVQILLLAAFASSCSKDQPAIEYGGDDSSTISFGTTAQWTKGSEVNDMTDISQLTLYSYLVEGGWGSENSSVEPYFTDDVATPITLTPANDEHSSWSYDGGSRYWPTDENRKLSFVAYYPASELAVTVENEGDEPEFSYTLSNLANDNEDLVLATAMDQTSSNNTNGKVNFAIEHLLTKLTLEVQTIKSLSEDDEYGVEGFSDYFFINGISFTGLYDGATLNIDTDGSTSWSVDKTGETIEVTAAHNNTLKSIFTYDESGNETGVNSSAALTETLTSVMESGKAIFVLPQDLGSNRDVAPTATIRIRRIYYVQADIDAATAAGVDPTPTGEIIYVSDPINIPVPTATADATYTGWEKGMHNGLQFTLDLSKIGEFDTALTLVSTIYPWTTVDVDVNVNPNIYIYASDSEFELSSEEETADMYIYTNYSSDLRLSTTNEELVGTLTTANGFTFYPYGSSNSYVPQLVSPTSTDTEEVLLEWGYDKDGNYVVGGTRDETTGIITGGTTLTTYEGNEGFPNMSAYYCDPNNVPGNAVPCYSYGNYSGTMNDEADWLKFKVTTESGYSFYFYGALLVRGQLGLYVNSAVETTSYGVNKDDNDAVYILRLEIEEEHLTDVDGNNLAAAGDSYGYFYGAIGAELLSNGGGKITYKFGVSLQKELSNN